MHDLAQVQRTTRDGIEENFPFSLRRSKLSTGRKRDPGNALLGAQRLIFRAQARSRTIRMPSAQLANAGGEGCLGVPWQSPRTKPGRLKGFCLPPVLQGWDGGRMKQHPCSGTFLSFLSLISGFPRWIDGLFMHVFAGILWFCLTITDMRAGCLFLGWTPPFVVESTWKELSTLGDPPS